MVSLAAKSKLYPARGLFLSDLDRAVFSDGAFRLAGLVSRTVKASLDRFELICRAASLEYGVVCIIFRIPRNWPGFWRNTHSDCLRLTDYRLVLENRQGIWCVTCPVPHLARLCSNAKRLHLALELRLHGNKSRN